MGGSVDIERWFREYSDAVFKFLIYYTGSCDVEDLVQEVFMKAIRSQGSFEGRSDPKTWLIAIARHTAIDVKRKQKIRKLLSERVLFFLPSSSPGPEEKLLQREDLNELYEEINRLKKNYRDVFILRHIMGLSVIEVSDVLQMSPSKVSVVLFRAIKTLKKKLSGVREGSEISHESIHTEG